MSCGDFRSRGESAPRTPVSGPATALPDATIVAVTIPPNSTELFFALSDGAGGTGGTVWEIGFEATLADAIPVPADAGFVINGPVQTTTIYVRQSSGGPLELRYGYLAPT